MEVYQDWYRFFNLKDFACETKQDPPRSNDPPTSRNTTVPDPPGSKGNRTPLPEPDDASTLTEYKISARTEA